MGQKNTGAVYLLVTEQRLRESSWARFLQARIWPRGADMIAGERKVALASGMEELSAA